MGTRSLTIILDGNQELVRFYRQYDGYPEGHGVDLAKLCDVKITNGIAMNKRGKPDKKSANGMGCLAAQIIAGLKDGPGNIYIEPFAEGKVSDWVEFVYVVRGSEGNPVTIECRKHSPETPSWPFNRNAPGGAETPVFSLVAAAVVKKYQAKATA